MDFIPDERQVLPGRKSISIRASAKLLPDVLAAWDNPNLSDDKRTILRLRLGYPDASHAELGAHLGLTKAQFANRLYRALAAPTRPYQRLTAAQEDELAAAFAARRELTKDIAIRFGVTRSTVYRAAARSRVRAGNTPAQTP